MANAAEKLFASITTQSDLDTLVREGREETLYLEFKQKADRRSGDIGDNDRFAFSKALSGFANADGGVLIFGIETKKNANGVDCAHSLKSINYHESFRTRLIDAILSYTQPVVDMVRMEGIAQDDGTGFVKCLIPASDKVPHRAMQAGREYWRRGASGFRRMEHYELADAFGRRLRPRLRLLVELRHRPEFREELHFYILNEGRGVAKHAGLLCTFEGATVIGVSGAGLQNTTSMNDRPTVQYYDAASVIHSNGIVRYLGFAVLQRPSRDLPFLFTPTLYAEDMETRGHQLLCAKLGVREMIL